MGEGINLPTACNVSEWTWHLYWDTAFNPCSAWSCKTHPGRVNKSDLSNGTSLTVILSQNYAKVHKIYLASTTKLFPTTGMSTAPILNKRTEQFIVCVEKLASTWWETIPIGPVCQMESHRYQNRVAVCLLQLICKRSVFTAYWVEMTYQFCEFL